MATIINLTPHEITVHDGGSVRLIPTSGGIARVTVSREVVAAVDGIPVSRVTLGSVEGLPEKKPDTYYLVSALVAQACPDREDLLSPGELVRDDNGRVIGCRGFSTT